MIAALDRHFERAPQPGGSGDEGGAGGGVPPAEALAQLRALLAEYSGDSTDYFDSVRPQLATLLPPSDIERLAAHMNNYEFEAASRMLAALQEAKPS